MSADELARAVRTRRAELGLSPRDLSARDGPSHETVRKIERAEARPYHDSTLGRFDRALGWAEGTARALLEGRTPPQEGRTPATTPATPPAVPPAVPERPGATVVAMLARASSTDELYALAHVVLDELARREHERETS